jgi:hypothetical protein
MLLVDSPNNCAGTPVGEAVGELVGAGVLV